MLVLGSAFLVVYQRHIPSNSEIGTQQLSPRWQDRGTKSKDYDENESNNLVMTMASGPGVGTPAKNYSQGVSASHTGKSSDPGKSVDLKSVFISVKTTSSFHKSRLPVILKTWFQLAKQQTWFFTDADDEHFQKETNNHMINTNCSSSHGRKALCCKMSVEFDVFLESNEKWFCHFDDDNYVNVPRLATLLANYSPQEDWYLGKPSIRAPLVILNREDKNFSKNRQNVTFWFATGGAGFCLSRALALKMKPIAGSGKFISIGERIRLPDDVTMGYIIEHMLGKSLTMVDEFHSHLEPMKFLGQDTFQDQITFSYSQYGKDDWNVVKIDGFAPRIDRTRFLSLHCYLFPYFTFCPR